MEIRDRLRDAEYFSQYVEQVSENIRFAQAHLKDNDGDEAKKRRLERFTVINMFDLFYGKYSAGYSLDELRGLFEELLGEASWVLFRFLYGGQLADPGLIIHVNDLGWCSVFECFVEALVVPPVHPVQRRELDLGQ